jgi:hypothetical protein
MGTELSLDSAIGHVFQETIGGFVAGFQKEDMIYPLVN